MKKILILILTLLLASNIFAVTTANEVEAMCENPFNTQACYAYFAGYAQGMSDGHNITITSNITDLTVRRMFMKHMQRAPQDGDDAAGLIISRDLLATGKAKLN